MNATLFKYVCSDCGHEHGAQATKCAKCGHVFSVNAVPVLAKRRGADPLSMKTGIAVEAERVLAKNCTMFTTGIPALDAALGGGIVENVMTVFSGDPGSGKSRFLRQLGAVFARRTGKRSLLISAEETNEQVRANLDKLGLDPSLFTLAFSNDLAEFEGEIFQRQPRYFVFDSLNYLIDSRVDGGRQTQRREAFIKLRNHLAARKVTSFVVAHTNSEDGIAEDATFERLPDAYFHLAEPMGPTSPLRELQVRKGRFYPPARVPLTMTSRGLV